MYRNSERGWRHAIDGAQVHDDLKRRQARVFVFVLDHVGEVLEVAGGKFLTLERFYQATLSSMQHSPRHSLPTAFSTSMLHLEAG